jgi:hypothetical protein
MGHHSTQNCVMIQKPNFYMFLDQLARMVVVEHGLMALVKKAGTLGIDKYNWKTRVVTERRQWGIVYSISRISQENPILYWAEHLSDPNIKKGLPPLLIVAAVLECMQKSSFANTEPKEVYVL